MKTAAARLSESGRIEIVERELEPGDDEVLVRTRKASICDADLRAYRGMPMPEDLPSFQWIGHEGGGEVIAVGTRVREFQPGDFAMCFGPLNSWATGFMGKPEQLLKVPAGMDHDLACLGEPTAVGLFGVFQSGVQLGDVVCVVGLNYQGLIAVEGLKKRGARRLIAIDDSAERLQRAQQRGADLVINSARDAPLEAVLDTTSGRGCDVVFHSCGYWNPNAESYFNLATELVRDEGIFVSIPDIMSPIRARLHRLHHHAIDVRFPALMHHNPEFLRQWVPRLLRPVAEGIIRVDDLITSSFPLTAANDAVAVMNSDPHQIKITLTP